MKLKVFIIVLLMSLFCRASWADEPKALAPYTGFVATRGMMPASVNSTNRQVNSRSPHYARTTIHSLQIIIPNWVTGGAPNAEVGTGSTATVTASIEYPIGTMTQVLFSGSPSGSIPNISSITSDAVAVEIPNGELFCVRIFWVSTTGVLRFNQPIQTNPHRGYQEAVSGLTDQTMSGTVPLSNNQFPPTAIIGTTTIPSVLIVGDSLGQGIVDTLPVDMAGDFGMVARSIGPYYGYSNVAQSGDRAANYVAQTHVNRNALMAYATHMICTYGSNDIYLLLSPAATVLTNLQTIWGYFTSLGGGRKAYQTNITTRTSSTDTWITLANQTVIAPNDERVALNALLRGAPAGLTDYFNVADIIEDVRDGGKWKPGNTANYLTGDGIHGSTVGYLLWRDSGVVTLTPQGGRGTLMPAGGPITGRGSNGGITGYMTAAAGPR